MALRFSNSSWVSFGKLCFLQKCPRKHFLICLHQVVYNIFLRFIFPFLKTITPELNFKFESVYLFCSRDSLSLSLSFFLPCILFIQCFHSSLEFFVSFIISVYTEPPILTYCQSDFFKPQYFLDCVLI